MTVASLTFARNERNALLERFVHDQANRLWGGYEADLGGAAAELARLRRALPRQGVTPPEAWEILARDFPDELRGRGDEPSTDELAATAALSLFALHQQSQRARSMHRTHAEDRLGRAAHTLMVRSDSGGVARRMQALVRASSMDAALEHLRPLVNLLRSAEIPLDYGRLAVDLQVLQRPDRVHRVRERWSRDFHRPIRRPDDTTADQIAGENPA